MTSAIKLGRVLYIDDDDNIRIEDLSAATNCSEFLTPQNDASVGVDCPTSKIKGTTIYKGNVVQYQVIRDAAGGEEIESVWYACATFAWLEEEETKPAAAATNNKSGNGGSRFKLRLNYNNEYLDIQDLSTGSFDGSGSYVTEFQKSVANGRLVSGLFPHTLPDGRRTVPVLCFPITDTTTRKVNVRLVQRLEVGYTFVPAKSGPTPSINMALFLSWRRACWDPASTPARKDTEDCAFIPKNTYTTDVDNLMRIVVAKGNVWQALDDESCNQFSLAGSNQSRVYFPPIWTNHGKEKGKKQISAIFGFSQFKAILFGYNKKEEPQFRVLGDKSATFSLQWKTVFRSLFNTDMWFTTKEIKEGNSLEISFRFVLQTKQVIVDQVQFRGTLVADKSVKVDWLSSESTIEFDYDIEISGEGQTVDIDIKFNWDGSAAITGAAVDAPLEVPSPMSDVLSPNETSDTQSEGPKQLGQSVVLEQQQPSSDSADSTDLAVNGTTETAGLPDRALARYKSIDIKNWTVDDVQQFFRDVISDSFDETETQAEAQIIVNRAKSQLISGKALLCILDDPEEFRTFIPAIGVRSIFKQAIKQFVPLSESAVPEPAGVSLKPGLSRQQVVRGQMAPILDYVVRFAHSSDSSQRSDFKIYCVDQEKHSIWLKPNEPVMVLVSNLANRFKRLLCSTAASVRARSTYSDAVSQSSQSSNYSALVDVADADEQGALAPGTAALTPIGYGAMAAASLVQREFPFSFSLYGVEFDDWENLTVQYVSEDSRIQFSLEDKQYTVRFEQLTEQSSKFNYHEVVTVIDDSNMFIEGMKKHAEKHRNLVSQGQQHLMRMDYGAMLQFAHNDVHASNPATAFPRYLDITLVGAKPPARDSFWEYLKTINIKPDVKERSVFNKEKKTDASIVSQIIDYPTKHPRSTLYLFSGDADFSDAVLRALKADCRVFVFGWGGSTSGEYFTNKEFNDFHRRKRFRVVSLDTWPLNEFTFLNLPVEYVKAAQGLTKQKIPVMPKPFANPKAYRVITHMEYRDIHNILDIIGSKEPLGIRIGRSSALQTIAYVFDSAADPFSQELRKKLNDQGYYCYYLTDAKKFVSFKGAEDDSSYDLDLSEL